jgi:hypothetical protein
MEEDYDYHRRAERRVRAAAMGLHFHHRSFSCVVGVCVATSNFQLFSIFDWGVGGGGLIWGGSMHARKTDDGLSILSTSFGVSVRTHQGINTISSARDLRSAKFEKGKSFLSLRGTIRTMQ